MDRKIVQQACLANVPFFDVSSMRLSVIQWFIFLSQIFLPTADDIMMLALSVERTKSFPMRFNDFERSSMEVTVGRANTADSIER